MKIKTPILLVLFFISLKIQAQLIQGTIKGSDNLPIPYATIYIQQLQTGTASNEKGLFEIKTGAGTFDIEFRALGYKTKKQQVEIGSGNLNLDIVLEEQVYNIAEITVKKGDEDPAYGIMRKAISLSTYYQNQVKYYKSTYYIKVNGNFKHIPAYIKTLMKLDKEAPNINSGDVFFTESVNEVTFNAPEKYFQKVISYKSTFPQNDQAQPMFIGGSFYNQRFWGGISPLSTSAFAYYKFRYEGVTFEKDFSVLKIKVTPKFTGKNLFTGYIYLVDKSFNIYSIDLQVPIQYGKSLVKQQYVRVTDDVWLPASFSAYNDMKAFGANAAFHILTSIKYNEVKVNKQQVAPKWLKKEAFEKINPTPEKEEKLSKREKQIQELLAKENPTKAEMMKLAALMKRQNEEKDTTQKEKLQVYNNFKFEIDKNALRTDSNFWKEARPIPLIAAEVKSLRIKDSLTVKPLRDTSRNDSLKPVHNLDKNGKNSVKLMHIVAGNRWADSLQNIIEISGLVNPTMLSFNTVDGFVYGTKIRLTRNIDSTGYFHVEPRIAYAFSRKEVLGKMKIRYNFSRAHMSHLELNTGVWSRDYNSGDGISPFMNSVASLFFRRNYLKLYESQYIDLDFKTELLHGLQIKTNLLFDNREPLKNYSNYSFFYWKDRAYTANIPQNNEIDPLNISAQNAFNASISLEYTPQMRYFYNREKDKVYAGSNYPTFMFTARKGITGVFESKSDFLFLSGGISQEFRWGISSRLKYSLKGGGFTSNRQVHFADFYHVSTQPLPAMIYSGNSNYFSLMPYYAGSTENRFAEGHINLVSPYMAMKYLPLLNLSNIKENIWLSAYTSPQMPKYFEIAYGWSNLPLNGTFKFVTATDLDHKPSFGFRLVINFSDTIVIGVDE